MLLLLLLLFLLHSSHWCFSPVCAPIAWCFYSPQATTTTKRQSTMTQFCASSFHLIQVFFPLSLVCLLSSLLSIRFLCIQTSQWFDHMCLHGIPLFLIQCKGFFFSSVSFNSQYDYRIYKHSHGINRFRVLLRVRVLCGVQYLYFAPSICWHCHLLSLVELKIRWLHAANSKNPKELYVYDGAAIAHG